MNCFDEVVIQRQINEAPPPLICNLAMSKVRAVVLS